MDALKIISLMVLFMALLAEGDKKIGQKQQKSEISVCCDEHSMRVYVSNEKARLVAKGKEENSRCKGFSSPKGTFLTLDLHNGDDCGTKDKSNTVVITLEDQTRTEMKVGCTNQCRRRRDLPPEFVEPDVIEITSEVTGTAPIPILSVGVRQNGQLVGGQINVRPGTPLTMEVFLDDTSADIYGILMNYMEVTDMANKRETIVFNGCSVDPVLFDNFLTETGDYLSAKFRAFKFPETNYVMFRGTVDVCLDKCQGIACSNGQLGYGRRRRGIDDNGADPNKIFQVTMTTILKVTENLNDTTGETRLVEEVQRVVEEVKTVEEVMEKVAEDKMREAVAVERELEGKSQAVVPWNRRPAIVSVVDERSSSNRVEPDYVYYNSAASVSQSVVVLMGVTCAALLALLL